MSSTLTPKQQQTRRRTNTNTTHQSRNTNAYIDRDEYHRRSFINKNHYWNHDYHRSNDEFYLDDYYQYHNTYPSFSQHIRKGRHTKKELQYNSKSFSSPNNNHTLYYDNIPPRHRYNHQHQSDKREQRSSHVQEPNVINKSEPMKNSNLSNNDEKPTKPSHSLSSSSTNSEITNNISSTSRKDLNVKNLAAAAIAARQQNVQPQSNLGVVQALMNSLILQQQQPAQSQSTIQLQYQLTNALLATMIQQRAKESVLQAQAQQIQAALPTLLAAQALIYQQQQQGQITANLHQTQPILPSHVAHPGTKFNNRPLVKFPVVRPTIPSGIHIQQPSSTTILPTYQQIQEIERGISLDQAINLKSAIDISNVNNSSIPNERENLGINDNNITE